MKLSGINDSNHRAVGAERPVQVMQNQKVKLRCWRRALRSIVNSSSYLKGKFGNKSAVKTSKVDCHAGEFYQVAFNKKDYAQPVAKYYQSGGVK